MTLDRATVEIWATWTWRSDLARLAEDWLRKEEALRHIEAYCKSSWRFEQIEGLARAALAGEEKM